MANTVTARLFVIQLLVLKVFMRDSQKYALQNKLQDEVLSRIIMIQRWVRAKLIRCHYLQVVTSVMTIQVMSLLSVTICIILHVKA